jgi:hypothetical protein
VMPNARAGARYDRANAKLNRSTSLTERSYVEAPHG